MIGWHKRWVQVVRNKIEKHSPGEEKTNLANYEAIKLRG